MRLGLSQGTLYLLGELKHLAWCLVGEAEHDGIEESMVGLETPRLCLDEGRLAHHLAYPFADETDGLGQVVPTVSEVRPQSEIYMMLHQIAHGVT